jgi:hypothetical protein
MDPLLDQARKEVRISDHIISVTMPMLKDKKLLLSATNHIEKSIYHIMCYFVKKSKKPIPSNQGLLKSMFFESYTGPQEMIDIVKDVDKIVSMKQQEQISFIKGSDIVILTSNYKTNVIKEEEIKEILGALKSFLGVLEGSHEKSR